MLWLNENNWFPSELEFHLKHTKPIISNQQVWATTKAKMDNPWAKQDFFYGQAPQDGLGPTVHTFVLPGDKDADPILSMHNARNATIRAAFMFFYPYNHGLKPFGLDFLILDNHIGDIETMSVTFKATKPSKVFFA
jgi:hypothetical protein